MRDQLRPYFLEGSTVVSLIFRRRAPSDFSDLQRTDTKRHCNEVIGKFQSSWDERLQRKSDPAAAAAAATQDPSTMSEPSESVTPEKPDNSVPESDPQAATVGTGQSSCATDEPSRSIVPESPEASILQSIATLYENRSSETDDDGIHQHNIDEAISSAAMQKDDFEDDYEEEAGHKPAFPDFMQQDTASAIGATMKKYGSRKAMPFTTQVRSWRRESTKFRNTLYGYVALNGATKKNLR